MQSNLEVDILKQMFDKKREINTTKKRKQNLQAEESKKSNEIIKKYDFFCKNEIAVANKIRNSDFYLYYKENLYLHESCSSVKISNIDLKSINYEEMFVLLKYPYLKVTTLFEMILQEKQPKLLVKNIMESFFLLSSLLTELNKESIYYLNLHEKNICFDENMNVFLKNYEVSTYSNYFENNLHSLKNIDLEYKPIETYIISYLMEKNEESISYQSIDIILKQFMKKIYNLHYFSQEIKEKYYEESLSFLQEFINLPKKEIFHRIQGLMHTWDHFSLSFIYLHIIYCITHSFMLKETFLNDFINECYLYLHPNPDKRIKLQNMYDLFNNNTKWDFIKDIDPYKMTNFYNLLLDI